MAVCAQIDENICTPITFHTVVSAKSYQPVRERRAKESVCPAERLSEHARIISGACGFGCRDDRGQRKIEPAREPIALAERFDAAARRNIAAVVSEDAPE